jgi:hypothetical protein
VDIRQTAQSRDTVFHQSYTYAIQTSRSALPTSPVDRYLSHHGVFFPCAETPPIPNQQEAKTIYCDNNGTIASTHDPHGHTRMKHIDIRIHFIRERVNDGTIMIKVDRVSGKVNPADIFTKALLRSLHERGIQLSIRNATGRRGSRGCQRVTRPGKESCWKGGRMGWMVGLEYFVSVSARVVQRRKL